MWNLRDQILWEFSPFDRWRLWKFITPFLVKAASLVHNIFIIQFAKNQSSKYLYIVQFATDSFKQCAKNFTSRYRQIWNCLIRVPLKQFKCLSWFKRFNIWWSCVPFLILRSFLFTFNKNCLKRRCVWINVCGFEKKNHILLQIHLLIYQKTVIRIYVSIFFISKLIWHYKQQN